MYLKHVCPNCKGAGSVPNIFTLASWIPFNWSHQLFVRCSRCYGRGYVCSKWHDRRRMH